MPTYIVLATYTEQGMRQVRESPKRLDKARAMLEEMGGEFVTFYMTMGAFDLMLILKAPDDAIAASFCLKLGTLGNIRTTSLKAFPEQAYREIIAHL